MKSGECEGCFCFFWGTIWRERREYLNLLLYSLPATGWRCIPLPSGIYSNKDKCRLSSWQITRAKQHASSGAWYYIALAAYLLCPAAGIPARAPRATRNPNWMRFHKFAGNWTKLGTSLSQQAREYSRGNAEIEKCLEMSNLLWLKAAVAKIT